MAHDVADASTTDPRTRDMQVPNNLLQRKQHCRERRVKRRCDRGRRSHRYQRFDFFGTQSEKLAQHRRQTRADLHRRTFAPEGNSARQRR
jgi:hypothetical protein